MWRCHVSERLEKNKRERGWKIYKRPRLRWQTPLISLATQVMTGTADLCACMCVCHVMLREKNLRDCQRGEERKTRSERESNQPWRFITGSDDWWAKYGGQQGEVWPSCLIWTFYKYELRTCCYVWHYWLTSIKYWKTSRIVWEYIGIDEGCFGRWAGPKSTPGWQREGRREVGAVWRRHFHWTRVPTMLHICHSDSCKREKAVTLQPTFFFKHSIALNKTSPQAEFQFPLCTTVLECLLSMH